MAKPRKADHTEPQGECLEKNLPCWRPECGSSDGVAHYSEPDREHCFSCNHTRFLSDDHLVGGTGASQARSRSKVDDSVLRLIESSSVKAIPSRKLTQEACKKFDYRVRMNPNGEQEHVAVVRDPSGEIIGVKLRNTGTKEEPKKLFTIIGSMGDGFYGQHLWPKGGKRLVIVGGEIDCVTTALVQDLQWPVVSPTTGEKSLAKTIKAQYDWVCSFQEVCIGTDMDKAGREAAEEAAKLLPPGKAKIVGWTRKDPNEMLMEGEGKQIFFSIFNAVPFRPGGIIDARTVTQSCIVPPSMGRPWPWKFMTDWTLGRRGGELYTFGAGSGLGKSDYLAEHIAACLQGKTRYGATFEPEAFALFAYESGPAQTKNTIAGKIAQRRFQIPQGHPDCQWTQDELLEVHRHMDEDLWAAGGKLFLMDTKGAADWEQNKELIRFLHHAEGVTNFMVDPIGALVVDEDEERKFLDAATLEAAKLAVELNSCVYFVSHLTRPSMGPSHEEGGRVALKQFRGSNGIGMYSNFVFGLERDQQADTEVERCMTTVRAVKDRLTGNSAGLTERLHYDRITGLLDPVYDVQEEEQPL